jgi:hypothetical protein
MTFQPLTSFYEENKQSKKTEFPTIGTAKTKTRPVSLITFEEKSKKAIQA